MEEHVKDAILTNEFHDLVLLRLVELTIAAERTGQPIFPDLLHTPVFFRKHFQYWIREALEEKKVMEDPQRGHYLDE